MRIRSHLDPTLFIIFLHINSQEYDAEFRSLVNALKPTKGTNLQPVFAALKERERRTMAHERYHFWQGLRLPFLHLYAATTLRNSFLGLRQLSHETEEWEYWSKLGPTVSGFDRLDRYYHLVADRSGKLAWGSAPTSSYELTLKYSAKDMLECAASVFDYQLSCHKIEALSSPVSLSRWRKLNPAYLRIFDFTAEFFDSPRLALRVILPMINASFHTSFPERAFVELLARARANFFQPSGDSKEFLKEKEPCRWPDLMQLWLSELKFDYPIDSYPDEISLDNGQFYYLRASTWLGLKLGGGLQHPFLGPPATEWEKRAKTVPGLEHYIDLPGYVANEEAHSFAFQVEPQLRIIRVFANDGADRVFAIGDGLVGPAFFDDFFSGLSVNEFRGFVLDLLAGYGAFRRATGANLSDVSRTCYHKKCPQFENNYCNCYPLIPLHYENCGFPDRLRDLLVSFRSHCHE